MRGKHLPAPEWQVVNHARGEDVTLIERGVPLVDALVIGVEGTDRVEAEVPVGVIDVVRPGVGRGEQKSVGGAVVELRLQARLTTFVRSPSSGGASLFFFGSC